MDDRWARRVGDRRRPEWQYGCCAEPGHEHAHGIYEGQQRRAKSGIPCRDRYGSQRNCHIEVKSAVSRTGRLDRAAKIVANKMTRLPPCTDVETALEEISAGRMIVLVDDE